MGVNGAFMKRKMKYKRLKIISLLTKAFEQLLKTETDYNVIIYAGKIHDSKEFHAHSNILRCKSKYFDNIISDKNIEKKDEKYVIYKLNISPQVFDVILKYLYADYVYITDKIGTELLNIIIASDELNLENLTRFTKDYIVKTSPIITK
ncbi:BTB/POZ domain-containing protein [Rhizophagus irregularis DAOM 181602=DAOM 197198]|nr:BTB/POZ domain-containing protein [Rhizophagus irregularis DAOM 181602=DAOM 197198]